MDYKETLDVLTFASRDFLMVAQSLDLKAAEETAMQADAVGPLFLPSEWMAAQQDGRLERQTRLIRAARHFLAELGEVFPDAKELLAVAEKAREDDGEELDAR